MSIFKNVERKTKNILKVFKFLFYIKANLKTFSWVERLNLKNLVSRNFFRNKIKTSPSFDSRIALKQLIYISPDLGFYIF